MIHGISGKPGGGKSYEAVVNHIIPVVTKDKRLIVTNLPINIDHFCSVYGEYCRDLIICIDGNFHDYGGLRPFSEASHYLRHVSWQNEKGQKAYFFIDECHLAMPTQGTQKELTEFFSMHRHHGFDIMLITQNFRKVNRDIKDMIVNHYRAIKKSMMGQDNKYILKVHDGASSSNGSVVATHERVYEKKYFSFYQSHTKSQSSVDEATSNDIEKWYKHWTIKASVVFFIFGIFIIITKLSDKEKSDKPKIDNIELLEVNEQRQPQQENKNIKDLPRLSSPVVPKRQKTIRDLEFEEMISKSKSFHPYYKMQLSISGYSKNVVGQPTVYYIAASQNGQRVFTMKNTDLMLAGYDVNVLTTCSIKIRFYDYVDYLTCNAPTQSVTLGENQQLASN